MNLLIDTHIVIWFVLDDPRMTDAQRRALLDPVNVLMLSPVVSYELTQLQLTHRIPVDEQIDKLQQLMGLKLIDLPSNCWRRTSELPDIHRDPIDRMQIAHALTSDFTIVTADQNIRRYDVAVI